MTQSRTAEEIQHLAISCEAVIRATRTLMTRKWCTPRIQMKLIQEIEELVADMRQAGIPLYVPDRKPKADGGEAR